MLYKILERGLYVKKIIYLMTCLLFISFAGMASAGTTEGVISLKIGDTQAQINGKNVTMPVPARLVDGRTLVPLRFIGEAFGCDVQWNNDTQTAALKLIDHKVQVPIGKKYALINDTEVPVQVPAQIIDGRTYVPLRFIGESLGAKLDYYPDSQQIIITTRFYTNETHGFKMILPSGWAVDKENTENVSLTVPGGGYCMVGLAEKKYGLTSEYFTVFADQWLKKYSEKDKIADGVEGNIAGIFFKEEGLFQLHSTKLLDNGIFLFVGAYPEGNLDTNIISQCELALNSLTN